MKTTDLPPLTLADLTDTLFKARQVLDWVFTERIRQEQLKKAGRFPRTCADKGGSDGERLAILTEELGEVARAMLKQPHDGPRNLVTELIQVAAIAVAWIEYVSFNQFGEQQDSPS